MNKEDKNIGNLFSELQNYKAEISEEEWLATEIKVREKNFFKFSLSNFNIYYCVLFLSSFVLSSIVFVDYFFLQRNSDNHSIKKEAAIPAKDSSSIKSNAQNNNVIQNNVASSNSTSSNSKPAIKTKELNNASEPNTLFINKDSVKLSNNAKPATSLQEHPTTTFSATANVDTATKKPKNKKIIYITRQDTLRVYDTLDTKNKTRKRRKK